MIFKSIFSIGCVCFVSYKKQHAPAKKISMCLKVGRLSSVLTPRVSWYILPNNCMNGGGAGGLLLEKKKLLTNARYCRCAFCSSVTATINYFTQPLAASRLFLSSCASTKVKLDQTGLNHEVGDIWPKWF